MVSSFKGRYAFLSNFFGCWVELDGQMYPSVEHAYQAAKTEDRLQRMLIMSAVTPLQAKQMGKVVPLRAGWDDMKLDIMTKLVKYKFSCDPLGVGRMLLETGVEELIEGNNRCDNFWGVCGPCRRGIHDGASGENWLGLILMMVRQEIRNGQSEIRRNTSTNTNKNSVVVSIDRARR